MSQKLWINSLVFNKVWWLDVNSFSRMLAFLMCNCLDLAAAWLPSPLELGSSSCWRIENAFCLGFRLQQQHPQRGANRASWPPLSTCWAAAAAIVVNKPLFHQREISLQQLSIEIPQSQSSPNHKYRVRGGKCYISKNACNFQTYGAKLMIFGHKVSQRVIIESLEGFYEQPPCSLSRGHLLSQGRKPICPLVWNLWIL